MLSVTCGWNCSRSTTQSQSHKGLNLPKPSKRLGIQGPVDYSLEWGQLPYINFFFSFLHSVNIAWLLRYMHTKQVVYHRHEILVSTTYNHFIWVWPVCQYVAKISIAISTASDSTEPGWRALEVLKGCQSGLHVKGNLHLLLHQAGCNRLLMFSWHNWSPLLHRLT